ncbi:MAG: DUF892 family protein [Rhodospirillales bacterium]|nr:DUF892 family protein [Rhodospirillales bacterium]
MTHAALRDEVIKDSLTGYAFEHFEIASYKALITMANTLGEGRIAETLAQSLAEEQEMARWLDANMEGVVIRFMSHHGASGARTTASVP